MSLVEWHAELATEVAKLKASLLARDERIRALKEEVAKRTEAEKALSVLLK
jgi:hypothetical protein